MAGRLPHVEIGRHSRFLRSDLGGWVMIQRLVPSAFVAINDRGTVGALWQTVAPRRALLESVFRA